MMDNLRLAAAVVFGILVMLLGNFYMAAHGNPQSIWLICDILKQCGE